MLRLGTRGSRLALCQAGLAADALRAAGLGPVAIVPISTVGDRDRRHSFPELGGRGIFSSELEEALLDGRDRRRRPLGQGPDDRRRPRTSRSRPCCPAPIRATPGAAPHGSLDGGARGRPRRHGLHAADGAARVAASGPARRGPPRQRRHAAAQARRARARRDRACRVRPRPAGPRRRDRLPRARPRSCCPRSARAFIALQTRVDEAALVAPRERRGRLAHPARRARGCRARSAAAASRRSRHTPSRSSGAGCGCGSGSAGPTGATCARRAARETTPSRSVARSPTRPLAAGGRSLLEAART